MSKYCVYLTIYKGNKLPPFYIGSTSIKKINEGYKGSVTSIEFGEIFKEELRLYPEKFSIKVLSIHNTRNEAYTKEDEIQRKLKVVQNLLYINKSYSLYPIFLPENKSTSHKNKIKISNLKSWRDPEVKEKHSKALKESWAKRKLNKVWMEEYSKKLSQGQKKIPKDIKSKLCQNAAKINAKKNKNKISERMLDAWKDPLYRKKQSISRKYDDNWKQKIKEGIKKNKEIYNE